MKKDKTLDYTNYQSRQFHVYALLLTRDTVFFNEGNKRPLKQSDYLHGPALKFFLNSLYESMNLPEPDFKACFGVSIQGRDERTRTRKNHKLSNTNTKLKVGEQ